MPSLTPSWEAIWQKPWGRHVSRRLQHWVYGKQQTLALPQPPKATAPKRDDLLQFASQAENLPHVWSFLTQWLAHPQLACLWLTTRQDYTLTIRCSWPQLAEPVHLDTRHNLGHHLEQCCDTVDTSYCHGKAGLGDYVAHLLPADAPLHYFSVPLKVAGQTQAIVTLGFQAISAETQQLVSRVYCQKELLGQMVAHCLFKEAHGSFADQRQLDAQLISQSLLAALKAKDPYTAGHSQAVGEYAYQLGQWIGLPEAELWPIRLAGQLHDIGKIGIPDAILNKPGPLTPEEWQIMETHPVIGAEYILGPIPALKSVAPLVFHHHEHWDGSGYPYQLTGDAIPLGSRIVAIVDAYHGLTTTRTYRGALTRKDTLALLQSQSGALWDPDLLQAFSLLVQNQPGISKGT